MNLHLAPGAVGGPLNNTYTPSPKKESLSSKVVAGGQDMEHIELSKGATAAVQSCNVLQEQSKKPKLAGSQPETMSGQRW